MGQFSRLWHSADIQARQPTPAAHLNAFFPESPAVNGRVATSSFKRPVTRPDSEAKPKRSSGEEPASSPRAPAARTTRCKLGQQEGRRRRYGSPAVSMATALLTQLLPPHLGQTRCDKDAAFGTVSSKTSGVRPTHFHLQEAAP